VGQSVEIGKPFIGVSINYRLHGWGWLFSEDVLSAGVTNLGLRDQRFARPGLGRLALSLLTIIDLPCIGYKKTLGRSAEISRG
jgi:hypothetical protein